MSTTQAPLDDYLRSLVRAIVQEVLAETGQAAVPKLHDPDEAADILRIKKRWLYEQVSAGKVPFRKVGRYLRFSDQDLQAIVSNGKGAA